jgi:hypothetical protein
VDFLLETAVERPKIYPGFTLNELRIRFEPAPATLFVDLTLTLISFGHSLAA